MFHRARVLPVGNDAFISLLSKYLKESHEVELSVPALLEELQQELKATGGVWIRWDRDVPTGFLCMALSKGIVFIRHVGLESGAGLFAIREIDPIIQDWALKHGSRQVYFTTRRNPLAFLRLNGPKWEVDSVVIRRAI